MNPLKPEKLIVQYLYNSGFTIDYRDYFIVIDYYRGDLHLPANKKILFIVSHGHEDHFNPAIFDWPGSQEAYYLLSDDIGLPAESKQDNIIDLKAATNEPEILKHIYNSQRVKRVGPNQTFQYAGLDFRSFGSTDRGISIWGQIYGLSFFHAGDLHAWKWPEMDEKTQKKEVADFVSILKEVSNFPIDLGFGLVDPRLKENAFVGPDLYLEHLQPTVFIPMHFRDETNITKEFAQHYYQNFTNAREASTYVHTIQGRGDRMIIQA